MRCHLLGVDNLQLRGSTESRRFAYAITSGSASANPSIWAAIYAAPAAKSADCRTAGFCFANTGKRQCASSIAHSLSITITNTFSYADRRTLRARGTFPPLSDRELVITAVGDVMLGTTFPDETGGLPPNDGADILREVTPILKRGDIVFGNLEGPLTEGGSSLKCKGKALGTCYAFRVPPRYGAHLKEAGFTVMGLANNHAMDFGLEGRTSSRQTLESQGIAHSGELGDIAHLTAKGKKISVIAFATYPGAYNLLDLDASLATIRQARAESDIVIVSFHGGGEGSARQHVLPGDETFLGEDRGDLRRFTHAAIDAGAQMVVGSGPHVVRGMEIYQGKLIAYSLGNFATYGPFNLSGENGLSLILEAHLADDGSFISGQVYPVRQEKPGGPRLDPAMTILPILRGLTKTDFGATGISVGPRGELTLPGTQVPECSNSPDILDGLFGTRPCGIYP